MFRFRPERPQEKGRGFVWHNAKLAYARGRGCDCHYPSHVRDRRIPCKLLQSAPLCIVFDSREIGGAPFSSQRPEDWPNLDIDTLHTASVSRDDMSWLLLTSISGLSLNLTTPTLLQAGCLSGTMSLCRRWFPRRPYLLWLLFIIRCRSQRASMSALATEIVLAKRLSVCKALQALPAEGCRRSRQWLGGKPRSILRLLFLLYAFGVLLC